MIDIFIKSEKRYLVSQYRMCITIYYYFFCYFGVRLCAFFVEIADIAE